MLLVGLNRPEKRNAFNVAIAALRSEVTRLFGTADAAEGVQSFVERRPARFRGC